MRASNVHAPTANNASTIVNVKKKARKHTSNGERNQYRRDEDQSVDDGSNNELSRSRATTKEVKPSDHNDSQTDHAHKRLLMAREMRFPEDCLYCTRPSD